MTGSMARSELARGGRDSALDRSKAALVFEDCGADSSRRLHFEVSLDGLSEIAGIERFR